MYQPPSAAFTSVPVYQPPSAVFTSVPVSLNINTSGVHSGSGDTTKTDAPHLSSKSKPPVEWSTELCNCCSNVKTCCLTFWCPWITFGRIAEIVDKGSTTCCYNGALYALMFCMFGCGWLYGCYYRSRMREQLGLNGNCGSDCSKHCCCSEYCALCQEYRELQNRGFNMVIGWHGNVERGIPKFATPPPIISGMNR